MFDIPILPEYMYKQPVLDSILKKSRPWSVIGQDISLHKNILQLHMKSVPHHVTIEQQYKMSSPLYNMSLSQHIKIYS